MSKSDFSAVTELVPQVSYDVIGRIIPGIIATLSLAIAVLGPTQAFAEIDVRVIHPDPPLSGWVVVPERLWLEVVLIVGIVGAFSSRKHISENQRLGLIDHWFILQCDRLPSSTEGHSDHEAQR